MDWISKIIEKFVDRYFEQKAVLKYLTDTKNLVKANHNKIVKKVKIKELLCASCLCTDVFQLQKI